MKNFVGKVFHSVIKEKEVVLFVHRIEINVEDMIVALFVIWRWVTFFLHLVAGCADGHDVSIVCDGRMIC